MGKKTVHIDDIELEQVLDFVENGDRENAPPEIVKYLDEMDKVRQMHQRFDRWGSKDAIVNHLIKVDGYSRYLANKLYEQSIEYFYADSGISKEAWRNVLAQKMEKAINLALLVSENTTDIVKVVRSMYELGRMLRIDQEDTPELPEELFSRPIKIYTTNPESVGLPPANRHDIAKLIDDNFPDIPETIKMRLKEESELLPLKVFFEEGEDPRKK